MNLLDSLDASLRLAQWDESEPKPEPLVAAASQLVHLLGTAERLAASKFSGRPDDVTEVEAICAVMRRLDAAYRVYRKQGGGAAKGSPELARASEALALEVGLGEGWVRVVALSPVARRPRTPAEPLPADRVATLERLAGEVAAAWVTSYLDSLSREGRPIEGGWPGTMPEARMRMDDHARHLLTARHMSSLSTDELGQFTRIVYDDARKAWLRHRSPVPSRKAREQT